MNAILSIFLCVAMLLGGAGDRGVEPESATTWTLRNLSVTLGDERVALAPELRLTAAAGAERAALRFELASGDAVYLPVSLDVTPEALRLALGSGGRAYVLTEEALEELVSIDGTATPEALTRMGDSMQNHLALLNMLRDPDAARDCSGKIVAAMLEKCAEPAQEAQVEIDGARYPGRAVRIHCGAEMMDALRGCGVPELEAMLESALASAGSAAGVRAESFAEFFAAQGDAEPPEAEMTLTTVEREDFRYAACGDFSMPALEASGVELDVRAATLSKGEYETTSEVEVNLAAGGARLECAVSERLEGDPYAPDSSEMDARIRFTTAGGDGALLSMTAAEERNESGLRDGELMLAWSDEAASADAIAAMEPAGALSAEYRQSAEGDGGVTTAVALSLDAGGAALGELRFELNRAEGAYADAFEGAELYEISEDSLPAVLEGDGMSPLAAALTADVSQLALDAMRLEREPGVRELGALAEKFANGAAAFASKLESGASDAGAGDDYDYDEDDYDAKPVGTLEEAAEIYRGALPSYAPPEGYELAEIDAASAQVVLRYENAGEGRAFSVYIYQSASEPTPYLLAGDELAPLDEPLVELYPDEYGRYYSAYVTTGDGARMNFDFNDALDAGELAVYLRGIQ